MIDKTVEDTAAAVSGLRDGDTVMIGGFGRAGRPVELFDALSGRPRPLACASWPKVGLCPERVGVAFHR